jgi:hypothetical protein
MRLLKLLVSGVVAAVAVTARAAEPLHPAKFESLHALIKPAAAEEKWAQIPWLASLWEARQRAAREGKPILLWEMDGHPLGCV